MEAHQLSRLTSATLSNDANVCMRHVASPSVRMFRSLDDDRLGGGGLHEGDGLESPIWRCVLGLFTILLEVLRHLGFWGLMGYFIHLFK